MSIHSHLFACIFLLSSADCFLKINVSKNSFRNTISIKQFGPRSGTGSTLFASFFHNFIFPSQHASNITYINIYNSLNQGLYLHTVFEFLVIYRGGGGGGGCSALVRMGPIAHVVQTALECTRLHGPVLLLQFVWQLKIKTLHVCKFISRQQKSLLAKKMKTFLKSSSDPRA